MDLPQQSLHGSNNSVAGDKHGVSSLPGATLFWKKITMNTLSLEKALVAVVAVSTLTLLPAQPSATTLRAPAPLGLPRLQTETKLGQTPALAPDRYAIDDLTASAAAGASRSRRDEVDVLALDAGREWSRPLRGSLRDVSFVSFQLHLSQGSIVEVGGARLGLTASPIGGNLQLMFDDPTAGALRWRTLNFHAGAGRYGGRDLAALPTLTVRLDPVNGTWDLYSGSRLLADSLPMIGEKKEERRFVLRAGSEGAWLSGLVISDENPLYEDTNANGIDDAFERQIRGAVLARSASVTDRRAVVQQWREAQRRKSPAALYVQRPRPDRVTAMVSP
jgi:hypothetical protein